MKRFIISIIALALLLLGYLGWHFRTQNHDVVHAIFRAPQFLNAFVTSQHVTAHRLHQRADAPGNTDLLNHYDWSNQVFVAAAQVQEIQGLLQRPSSYDWNTRYAKACILNYGVILQFQADSNTVSVALCFDCNMLGVYGTSGTNVTQLNTAIKPIFPDDAEIQKLR